MIKIWITEDYGGFSVKYCSIWKNPRLTITFKEKFINIGTKKQHLIFPSTFLMPGAVLLFLFMAPNTIEFVQGYNTPQWIGFSSQLKSNWAKQFLFDQSNPWNKSYVRLQRAETHNVSLIRLKHLKISEIHIISSSLFTLFQYFSTLFSNLFLKFLHRTSYTVYDILHQSHESGETDINMSFRNDVGIIYLVSVEWRCLFSSSSL